MQKVNFSIAFSDEHMEIFNKTKEVINCSAINLVSRYIAKGIEHYQNLGDPIDELGKELARQEIVAQTEAREKQFEHMMKDKSREFEVGQIWMAKDLGQFLEIKNVTTQTGAEQTIAFRTGDATDKETSVKRKAMLKRLDGGEFILLAAYPEIEKRILPGINAQLGYTTNEETNEVASTAP